MRMMKLIRLFGGSLITASAAPAPRAISTFCISETRRCRSLISRLSITLVTTPHVLGSFSAPSILLPERMSCPAASAEPVRPLRIR